MIKKYLYPILLTCFLTNILTGQLPNGSYAPDFTVMDIDSNMVNLYSYLDEGKTIILDISATWCGPCWDYHTSGALETLHELYGNMGSDEIEIMLVEGDDNTSYEDLIGTGDNTLGDWTEGTHYTIIDSRAIAELYQINFFPTLFMICPNRTLYQINQSPAEEIYQASLTYCQNNIEGLNAAIINYQGFEGSLCGEESFAPTVVIQNQGTEPIENYNAILFIDGIITQTIPWQGFLDSYHTNTIMFDTLNVIESTNIKIMIEGVNNSIDLIAADNTYLAEINVANFTNESQLSLEIKLDNAPYESYWEIVDEEENILYFGGDSQIAYSNSIGVENYSDQGAVVQIPIVLAATGCFEFRIYDSFGNGLDNTGYYKLIDQNGIDLIPYRAYNSKDVRPFGISQHPGTILNAAIVSMQDLPFDYCAPDTLNQSFKVLNIGNEKIESLVYRIKTEVQEVDFLWEGNISINKAKNIQIEDFITNESGDHTIEIVSVNGEIDQFNYRNSISKYATKRETHVKNWIIDITTDYFGYELYWDLLNSNGEILTSGGNLDVGPNGGGLQIATEDDQGAYPNHYHIEEVVSLETSDCYTLRVVDDGGNGFISGFGVPKPFVRIRNNSAGIITDTEGDFTNIFESNIQLNLVSKTGEIAFSNLSIFPNPTSEFVIFEHSLEQIAYIKILNTSLQTLNFTTSNNQKVRVELDDIPPGVYLCEVLLESGEQVFSKIVKQ